MINYIQNTDEIKTESLKRLVAMLLKNRMLRLVTMVAEFKL